MDGTFEVLPLAAALAMAILMHSRGRCVRRGVEGFNQKATMTELRLISPMLET